MNLQTMWRTYGDEKAHPYICGGAQLLVEGITLYCVFRYVGLRDVPKAACLVAVVDKVQAIALRLLTPYMCHKLKEGGITCLKRLPTCIVELPNQILLGTVADYALLRLGVQLCGWKVNLAIMGINILVHALLFPK